MSSTVKMAYIAISLLLIMSTVTPTQPDDMKKVKQMLDQLANLEKSHIEKSLRRLHGKPLNRSRVSQSGSVGAKSVILPLVGRPPVGLPSSARRPAPELRKSSHWSDYHRYYALEAPPGEELLVRHAPSPHPGTPWPMPQEMTTEQTIFRLSRNFNFKIASHSCDILEFTTDRIRNIIFGGVPGTYKKFVPGSDKRERWREITTLTVTVLSECSKYPSLESDESYYLTVDGEVSNLLTNAVWGAVRGLETFSQLVYPAADGQLVVNKSHIYDFPRFRHRGFLLDTSRHYISRDTIIQHLEAMAMNKMNVFHWHIVDDQSFPYQSQVFPDLSRLGAFHPEMAVYTPTDIQVIIEEARMRGIRVIPEFDSPGHTLSWGFGQDDLLVRCYDSKRKPTKFFGPINPVLNSTFTFLRTLYKEVLDRFPDNYIHLGGDEVPFTCWLSNPDLQHYIRKNNLPRGVVDLLENYQQRLHGIIADLRKSRPSASGAIVWQEVVDSGLKVPNDTIVHLWKEAPRFINKYTAMGLRVIYSSCWYLDHVKYGQDWETLYTCESGGDWPLTSLTLDNETMMIGGEACMWNEYSDDSDVIARMWPRGSAVAERLWSSAYHKYPEKAGGRIEEQRCRMLRHGLPVGVLSGPGFCNEHRRKRPTSFSGSSTIVSQQSGRMDLVANASTAALVLFVVFVSFGLLARIRATAITQPRPCGIVGNRKLLIGTYMVALWVMGSVWLLGFDSNNGETVGR